ncbi:hypothetical protein LOTGIDRAFT_171774 [Lottia gigantea]|uniref:Uncharacterized protein n=1 Tax=Lottia gigantea TaxID=225164 RepID=V4AF98_LOTGI|nr:hypothetical protein LOTGIDRAFT_171774 [Lottia gigantea]ESP02699.1 hypothetical protein LOTGIDRAFT_171774 [Lottia gigantea]
MFSWLKKRCRRKSAPSLVPVSKRIKSNVSVQAVATPVPQNPYFTLEDEPEYHIYESEYHIYEEVNYSALHDMSAAVTSLTSKLMDDFEEDNIWCKRETMTCPLCRKEQSCDCITSDFESDANSTYHLDTVPTSTPDPFARLKKTRRSFHGNEILRCNSHVQDTINKQRRPVHRAMSDIQQRPLPAIPIRSRLCDVSSDDDSSGFYETMNSESDLYEEVSTISSPSLKCTTV